MLMLLNACLATAGVFYVDCNGPNDPGSGTFQDPFRQIQAGIDAAGPGDTVQILPGVYTGSGNYNLDPGGKSITIRSTNPEDAEIIANTVIDPNKNGRGFYIHSGEDSNCIIAGLTIRNAGIPGGYNGAGIYCYNNSPTIINCVIQNGYAQGSGGGLCLDYSNSIIVNCTIKDNMADYYGGGIGLRFSSPTIIGCTISGNTAYGRGGGIDSGQSDPNIIHCVITNNTAPSGGGINCFSLGITNVVNCTLVGNLADYVGAGVYCQYQGNAHITNSIIWANIQQLALEYEGTISVTYCDVQGGQIDVYDPCGLLVWGEGNIDTDPCFASFDFDIDPNLWDFHLQSTAGRWNSTFYKIDLNKDSIINLFEFARLAGVWLQQGSMPEDLDNSGLIDWTDMELFAQYYLANSIEDGWIMDSSTSPCIDGGDPNSDWTGEPWPNGKRINMGAYGGTSQASKSGNIADFDIDGKVDFIDFALFAKVWNENTAGIEDLNGNGVVDAGDIEIIAANWLWEKQ
jgi:parallel beta-helix repeat protein